MLPNACNPQRIGFQTRRMALRLLILAVAAVDAYTVLHLADFHLDVDYSTKGDASKMCHVGNQTAKATLGSFGDYMCDSPKPLVQHAIDEAKRLFPDPDLLLWTGDNTPHVDGYDWNYVMNAMNTTTTLLFSKFPKTQILPTFGNHDYAPANAFDLSSTLYSRTWDLWSKQLGDQNKATFLSGGYYKLRLKNATAVVLNTNLYYNANKAYGNFTDKTDPAGQFAFMEAELQAAEQCPNRVTDNCTSQVHIIAHIGPGVFERSPNFTWFRPEYNEKFLNLTTRYANSIGWMIFGHHHTDTFHLIKDQLGNVVQLALMAPSVTPWFSDLPGAGANNPSFRTYETDDYGKISDINTYYINLDDLNKNASTPFVFEYSFKQAYGIFGDVTPRKMSDVLENMKKNDSLFQTYINYNSVLWKPAMPQGIYRGAQLCSMEWSDYPRYDDCMKLYSHAAQKFTIPIFSLLFYVLNQL
ncbi:unnamed protein product [Caenorhabditis auriculariae]|uniref:Calcineurin-like phosphoesterase domain-containing protein n=1 Tax=Caenorhabditis auriculariae TaxID=2777116 RepID=A0A8S1HJD1_9PELO|nr:unnamed protein product [Caenorhabditis auriculariae]